MGGEKSIPFGLVQWPSGSPPHGRGKAFSVLRRQFRFRITPAQAGKRQSSQCGDAPAQDHPRVGGEKEPYSVFRLSQQGSPPHGRGKVRLAPLIQLLVGITPAWAGKSMTAPGRSSRTGDHPRVGGEKLSWSRLRQNPEGSPPRGRGKVADGLLAGACPGITPALAGKSPASQPWSPPLWMMVIRPRP